MKMVQATERVALLTGCDQRNGIGSASAKALAENGVKVVVSALQQAGSSPAGEHDGLSALVDEIKSAGGEAFAVRGDIRMESDTKRLVDVASLPPDAELALEWDAFLASVQRPAAQTRIKKLMDQGFHQPGDVETRLGYYVGQLGS